LFRQRSLQARFDDPLPVGVTAATAWFSGSVHFLTAGKVGMPANKVVPTGERARFAAHHGFVS
jgi:hypothetical protein